MVTPSVELNSGFLMPTVGLGTWKSGPGEVVAAVGKAIEVGYRHIDCAHLYQNEAEVGAGIRAKLQDGTVTREELFVTSKLWANSHHPDDVRAAFMTSLKKLDLKYLDLYLIHTPMAYKRGPEIMPVDGNMERVGDDTDYMETWKCLEQLQEEGLVRSIGVSNFNKFQVERVLREGKVPPAVNQIELHPYLVQEELVTFCQRRGVVVTSYSSLGSSGRPWAKKDDPRLLEDPKLKTIADKVGKTVAQVLLRFLIQRGVTVIPKSVKPTRIESNFKIYDFELREEDMSIIKSFDRNWRAVPFPGDENLKYFPFVENYSE